MAVFAKQSVSWRDARGYTARNVFYITGAATIADLQVAGLAIINAIAAVTNAVEYSSSGPEALSPGVVVYGSPTVYSSVEDKADLVFQDSGGGLHHLRVPSPAASVFLADGLSVNELNTNMAALIHAFLVNAATRQGTLMGAYLGGVRRRVKQQRRIAITHQSPALGGAPEE